MRLVYVSLFPRLYVKIVEQQNIEHRTDTILELLAIGLQQISECKIGNE